MHFAEVSREKHEIRQRIWNELSARHIAPDCHDKIPDFTGKQQAAHYLAASALWQSIIHNKEAIMTAPDSVLEPVRAKALQDGIPTYMAAPGLKQEASFVNFGSEPIISDIPLNTAYGTLGECIALDEMSEKLPYFGAVIGGSVAVDGMGNRMGKGKGYFDTEVAALKQLGKISTRTHILTVVHSLQVVDSVPTAANDACLTEFVTEQGMTVVDRRYYREPPDLQPALFNDETGKIPLVRWLLEN